MNTPKSAKERIKGAQRLRRSTRINLRGDLVAEIETLEIELVDVREKQGDAAPNNLRLGQQSDARVIAERITALQEAMEDEWLDLVLEQRSWAEWRDFKVANPARENTEYDELMKCNFDNLVEQFMPKCVVEPKLDAEDWQGIFDKCAPADIRDLGAVAYGLHERGVDIPKSRLASVVMLRSDEDLSQPAPGESASAGSTGGSHLSTTSTTTPTEPEQVAQSSPESPSGTSSSDDEPRP